MPSRSALVLLSALVLAIGGLGCGVRYQRTLVQEQGGLKTQLRTEIRGRTQVHKGHSHPATIAPIRVSHILARIDVRMKEGEGERKPAIPTEMIYALGDAVSLALTQAKPDQEIVVQAFRKERSLGIFTQRYYTAFLAWVRGGDLFLDFYKVDELIPKGEEDDVREPRSGEHVQGFKVLAADGLTPLGQQVLAADWRNPIFRTASNIHVDSRGNVQRRTVLMESAPVDDTLDDVEQAMPVTEAVPNDPLILRALADLEERRQSGEITELEYQRQRRELIRTSVREGE